MGLIWVFLVSGQMKLGHEKLFLNIKLWFLLSPSIDNCCKEQWTTNGMVNTMGSETHDGSVEGDVLSLLDFSLSKRLEPSNFF